MRNLVIIPVAVLAVLFCGYMIAGAMSKTPPLKEMIAAAIVCLVASEAAMIPIVLTRGASQASVAQAGLVGTIIHLFVSCGLGGGLIITKAFGLSSAFAYWLIALYWLTLFIVVIGFNQAVKAAPIAK